MFYSKKRNITNDILTWNGKLKCWPGDLEAEMLKGIQNT